MPNSQNPDKSGKILVVDDQISVRMVLEIILLGSGHKVVSTGDPKEVASLCEQNDIDAVLLDLEMPEASGIDVCQEIRKYDKNIPIIMLSENADSSTCQKTLTNGAVDFIKKPVEASEVLIRVKNAVKVRILQRQLEDQARKYRDVIAEVSRLDDNIHEMQTVSGEEERKHQLSEILAEYTGDDTEGADWYPGI